MTARLLNILRAVQRRSNSPSLYNLIEPPPSPNAQRGFSALGSTETTQAVTALLPAPTDDLTGIRTGTEPSSLVANSWVQSPWLGTRGVQGPRSCAPTGSQRWDMFILLDVSHARSSLIVTLGTGQALRPGAVGYRDVSPPASSRGTFTQV